MLAATPPQNPVHGPNDPTMNNATAAATATNPVRFGEGNANRFWQHIPGNAAIATRAKKQRACNAANVVSTLAKRWPAQQTQQHIIQSHVFGETRRGVAITSSMLLLTNQTNTT